MKHLVLGTAGHIDHGKSALVRALTGIEPDRWEEERRRGITIDLGFAHLDLDSLRIAFIDVPGHERFIRNMLAGAGGIDAVVLVVAADESIMPQTREHFDICRLLGIRHGVVALTKSDLVSEELLELVRMEIEEFMRGSFLEGAPVIAVSAKTGAGLEELKRELLVLAGRVAGKDSSRHLRLPVDRSFTLKGFGTVVTGTLISGCVESEQEVEMHPLGRVLRVRGLQVHNESATRASAGQRTAVNLVGVEAVELGRGMTLAEPGVLRSTTRVDAEIELLATARALKHGAPIHFHAWTSETAAKVQLLEANFLEPGSRGMARLSLEHPVLLLPGDRFILRTFAPPVTVAGGVVVDIDGPERMRRPQLAKRTAELAAGTAQQRVERLVRESAFGMPSAELVARTGLRHEELNGGPWFVDREWLNQRRAAMEAALAAFHKQNPLLPGMPLEELRSRALGDAPAFLMDHVLRESPTLVTEKETIRLRSHQLAFQEDEAAAIEKIEAAFAAGALAVPATNEVLARCGVEPARARALLQVLLRQGRLIKVSPELVYHAGAIEGLRTLLAGKKGARFSVSEFKNWTGVSRKYAIPLLEFLDHQRVTRREGETRLVV
ncbi:MAG TPA: selenocysteine-specific translation elongation factor [Bryobacteraceae bacterium]|nr:selenocysteine-specific translation elongation factor [Bryobacteraceae bacterium]